MNTTNLLDIYYQHISPGDQYYKQVTKLLYIDDTDPSMILYYFADGTKCNALFVAPVNTVEDSICKYYMVQLNDKNSIWNIDKIETKAEYRTVVNEQGETFTMPMLDKNNKPILDKIRYEYTAPKGWGNIKEKDTSYYKISIISNKINDEYEFDNNELNIVNNIPHELLPGYAQISNNNDTEEIISEHNEYADINESETLPDIEDVLGNTLIVINEKNYTSIDEIVKDLGNNIELTLVAEVDAVKNSLAQKYEEKLQSIQATSVSITNPLYEELKANVPENMCNVVEQMIENAHSDTAVATIELSLPLPPKELYNLLKTAYTAEWPDAFIKLLASHVDIKDLQYSLASGLHSYYDPDYNKE